MNSCLITIVHFYPQNRFVEHFLFRLWVYPHDCLEMMMDVKVMELNVFLKKTLVQNIMMVWMKTSDPSSLSRSFFWMKMMMELLHAFEEQKWRQMTKINSAFMSSLLNTDVAPPTFRCVIHPESTLSLFSEWRLSRMSVWRLHLINIHHFVPSAVDCRTFPASSMKEEQNRSCWICSVTVSLWCWTEVNFIWKVQKYSLPSDQHQTRKHWARIEEEMSILGRLSQLNSNMKDRIEFISLELLSFISVFHFWHKQNRFPKLRMTNSVIQFGWNCEYSFDFCYKMYLKVSWSKML